MENHFLKIKTILYTLILSLFFNLSYTQQLAFPTAYGGGAYASGGRGGNVYKVTNLLDDGSVGSFRWAVTQARPATIIFDVSGIIQLISSLIVQGDDLTVAGQTAPQGGITITSNDKNIRFGISRFNSVENHIWRYIKVRAQYQGNDEYQNIQQYAGNAVTDYTRNIILDHLSISGAQYMAYSIRGEGSENVTLQNIMFGQNAKTALFGDTDDLFSKDFTFRNNTIYHSTHRVPNTSAQNVDVYNNVVYDWKSRLTVIKNGTAINHFNNYYYKGTRTNLGSSWNGAPENFIWEVNGITTNADSPVTIYSKNNVIQDLYVYDDNDVDISNAFQDDRYIWMHHAGQLVDGTEILPDRQQRNKADDSYFIENPMPYAGRVPSTFLTAEEAKTVVPNDSGAYKYLKDDGTVGEFRDALDTEYHNNIINDNATDFAYDGGVGDPANSTLFTNFVTSISTTPINLRPVDFYDTNDYIPQVYLDAEGIIGNSTIHNEIQPDGYTLLEHYINQVDNTEDIDNSNNNNNNLLAFPDAYGAGAYTIGGRGYNTYKVTNLNDSGDGSFRQAISDVNTAGGGNIIFDVSGVINLNSILGLPSNCSVLGQTAPEGGITIDGDRVYIQDQDNLIVRYIRFRNGVDGLNDSVTVRGSVTNQIWDHCSFGFGVDEAASWYEGSRNESLVDNLTVQRCLFSESSTGSIVGVGESNTNESSASYLNNLFFNISHRFPNVSGANINVDVINNVVWDVGNRLVRVNGAGQNLNHIGNYYHFNDTAILNSRVHMFSYNNGYPNIYTSGNKIVASITSSPLTSTVSEMNADNKLSWKHFINGTSTPYGIRNKGDQLESDYFVNTQHPILGREIQILSADDAFINVSEDVGANKRLNADGSVSDGKDVEDTTYLIAVVNGTYLAKDTVKAVTPIASVSRPAGYYNTNEYIPQAYLDLRGIAGDATIHNQIQPSGYTLLEEFVNSVDYNNQTLSIPEVTPQNRFPIGYKYQMYNILGQLIEEGKIEEGTWNKLKEGYKGFYIFKIENGIVWKTIF